MDFRHKMMRREILEKRCEREFLIENLRVIDRCNFIIDERT